MSELAGDALGPVESDDFDAHLERWRSIYGLTRTIIEKLGQEYSHANPQARCADWSNDQFRFLLQANGSGRDTSFYLNVRVSSTHQLFREFYYSVSERCVGLDASFEVDERELTPNEVENELLAHLLEITCEHPDIPTQAGIGQSFWEIVAREVIRDEADMYRRLRHLGQSSLTHIGAYRVVELIEELQARRPEVPSDVLEIVVPQLLREARAI